MYVKYFISYTIFYSLAEWTEPFFRVRVRFFMGISEKNVQKPLEKLDRWWYIADK